MGIMGANRCIYNLWSVYPKMYTTCIHHNTIKEEPNPMKKRSLLALALVFALCLSLTTFGVAVAEGPKAVKNPYTDTLKIGFIIDNIGQAAKAASNRMRSTNQKPRKTSSKTLRLINISASMTGCACHQASRA